jgi:purine nucleosidase
MKKTPVIFIHDAAIDEYMVTVLLTTMEEVDLRGIIIVNAEAW